LYAIEDLFSQKLGEPVALDVVVEGALIAGVNVVVEGVSYDGSAQGQLLKLATLLGGGP